MQRAPAEPPPHRPPSPSPGIQWFLLLNPRARMAGATLLATRSMSQCYPILKLALTRRSSEGTFMRIIVSRIFGIFDLLHICTTCQKFPMFELF